MTSTTLRRIVCQLAALFLPVAWAQDLSISGTVMDAQGVIQGADVSLKGIGGAARQTNSGANGEYRFNQVAPGTYELSFTRSGFEAANRTVTLSTQAARIDVTLAVGAVSTTIEVTEIAGRATSSRMPIPDIELPVQVST